MPINTKQIVEIIIQPTLKNIGMYSLGAEQLIVGTCAQESAMGTYIHQIGSGPAMGIFEMEPGAHDDIHRRFAPNNLDLMKKIYQECSMPLYPIGVIPDASIMTYNLKYAVIMCRLFYYQIPERLPFPGLTNTNISAFASYWKRHYNTSYGDGTIEQFVINFTKYVKPYYEGKL